MSLGHDLAVRRAKYVAGLSDEQLGVFERGPMRWLLVRAIPVVFPLKFRKDVAGDINGVLELSLIDPRGGTPDRIQLVMKNGRCRGTRKPTLRPDSTATMHIADLVRLGAACVEAGWLTNDGRVLLSGDPFLFVRFPAAFGLHTRPLYAEPRGPKLRP